MVTQSPSLTSASQSTVLLVITPLVSAQRDALNQFIEKIRSILNPSIRIIQVNEAIHPEIVRSFNFSSLPAFALLHQGQELWHQTGPIDQPDFFRQLYQNIQDSLLKTLPTTHYEPGDSH